MTKQPIQIIDTGSTLSKSQASEIAAEIMADIEVLRGEEAN